MTRQCGQVRVGTCLLALLCLLGSFAGSIVVAATSGDAGAALRGARPHKQAAQDLPPGLGSAEHAALAGAGAYGNDPVNLLIVGDSIALTLGMGLSEGAQTDYGVTVTDNGGLGCDLDPQLEIRYQGQLSGGVQGCAAWKALWPLLVAAQRPQVVALGLGRWEVADHLYQGHWVHIGDPGWDAHLTSDLRQAVAVLHSFGARVVLFTMPYVDPTNRPAKGKPYDEDSPVRTRQFNALLRQVARSEPGVMTVMDLNHMLAPNGRYEPSVDGIDVRSSDGIHISPAGGALLQREILPEIAQLGLAAEPAVAAAGNPANRTTAAGSRDHG